LFLVYTLVLTGEIMAKIIGFDEIKYERFTCSHCCAIVEYAPNEALPYYGRFSTPIRDAGQIVKGLNCPNCGKFHRTNP